MNALVDGIVGLARDHPALAGGLVFATAFLEAIVIVGLFIPGTSILVAVGATLAFAHLPIWPVIALGALGAILGNTISYYLGRRHKDLVLRSWPFRSRPELWSRTQDFLDRHGVKSVAIGRFLPVIRPMIPFAAGAALMPPARFQIVNIVSAALWAPAYILPAAVGGWSFAVLSGASKRWALLALLLILLIAGAAWILRLLWTRVTPPISRALAGLAARAEDRDAPGSRLIGFLLSRSHADVRTALVLSTLILGSWLLLGALIEDVLERGALMRADAAVSNALQHLRTEPTDAMFLVATLLGDTTVAAALSLTVIGYLILRRAFRLAAGLGAVMVSCAVFVPLAKLTLHVSRPTPLYTGFDAFSFPSGHATAATALYGLLSWLFLSMPRTRLTPVALLLCAAALVIIPISRVYLAAHWPSDVAAGMLVGLSLTFVCALLFRRSDMGGLSSVGLLAVVLAGLASIGALHVVQGYPKAQAMYAVRPKLLTISYAAWRGGAVSSLPMRRIDLAGEFEEPFAFYWAGDRKDLLAALWREPWRPPGGWGPLSSFGIFPNGTLSAQPVVPVLHDGEFPALTLVALDDAREQRRILRVWRTNAHLVGRSECSIWVASIVRQPSRSLWAGYRRMDDEEDDFAALAPPVRRQSPQCGRPESGTVPVATQ